MRFISPKIHGIIDYLLVIFIIASPKLFALEPKAANFTYALAVAHFVITIATNYKYSVAKVIPFSAHGVIELVVGLGLIIVAYSYFSTDRLAQMYYAWLGGILLVLWLFTNYEKPKKVMRKVAS